MTTHTIKFKRGVKSKLNNLSYGEPAYISDENELYIGTENGVEKITRNKEVAELSSQLEHKANYNSIFTMSNMGQDIKEAMTGGSVAVVGKDTVSMENLMHDVKSNLYDICTPNCEVLISSNNYSCDLQGLSNINISIQTNKSQEFVITLANENLFNKKGFQTYSNYISTSNGFVALPIYLEPNTTYTVYAYYKKTAGEANGITGTNLFINQDYDKYASGGSALNLKGYTDDISKELTTGDHGCLFLTPQYCNQASLDALFEAFDIMIVKKGVSVSEFVEPYNKTYSLNKETILNTENFKNLIVNIKRDSLNLGTAMPSCDIKIYKKELDYNTIKNNLGLLKEKSKLTYYTENWASFWYTDRVHSSMQSKNAYFAVSGNKGDSFVTVSSSVDADLSLLDSYRFWGGVLGYGDSTYKSCLVLDSNSTTKQINIYPPLEKDIINGELGNMAIDGMHLTKLGYRAYMQHNYSQNPKHCEKNKYIKKFSPCIDGDSKGIPFTKFGGRSHVGISVENVNANFRNSFYNKYYSFSNPWDSLLESKSGIEWEVDLSNLQGYCEIFVGCANSGTTKFLKDEGFELYIEFYQDGILTDKQIKTTNDLERYCFDFKNSKKGKIVLYYNKVRNGDNGEHIIISDCTWWVNEYNHSDKLIPNYNIVSQLFDSWGEFHNGESGIEMSRLINESSGLTVPYFNTSKGSQTSAWGKSWWFENVLSKRPNIMIADFGINDCNSIPYNLPNTVTGSDGVEYNNQITKEIYKENLNIIFDLCHFNNIQPIMFGGTMGSLNLGFWYLYLTYGIEY